jgi:hypothetical protein
MHQDIVCRHVGSLIRAGWTEAGDSVGRVQTLDDAPGRTYGLVAPLVVRRSLEGE